MITINEIANRIRDKRRELELTQKELAVKAVVGLKFIIELEQGKDSCPIGKVLEVLENLGIEIDFK